MIAFVGVWHQNKHIFILSVFIFQENVDLNDNCQPSLTEQSYQVEIIDDGTEQQT